MFDYLLFLLPVLALLLFFGSRFFRAIANWKKELKCIKHRHTTIVNAFIKSSFDVNAAYTVCYVINLRFYQKPILFLTFMI